MTDRSEAERVVKGLSKAQRCWLVERAKWRSPSNYCPPRWMTFPPSNTHRVLMERGLMDRGGQILTLGLAVRAILQDEHRMEIERSRNGGPMGDCGDE